MEEEQPKPDKEELSELLINKLNYLKELEQHGKDSKYIKELSDIAFLQLQLEQFVDSEKNYLVCLKHFKKQKDRLGQAAVYGVLGTLNFKKANYHKSIEYYENAYNIYDELKQIQEQITCLKGIGNCYIKLNQLNNASEVFLECSAISSDNEDIYNLLDCLGNLTFIHEKLGNYDILYELYKKSLESFKQIKDEKGIIVSYFNLGIIRKKEKKFRNALTYFEEGLSKARECNYAEFLIKGYSYIGEIFYLTGEANKAKNEFLKALKLASQVKAKNAILQLKIVLKSLGLNEREINNELQNTPKS